tara:strand:+ start:5114 stop:5917 length:804 start_codon:yes stop_codon:yes gene_type:complete
MPAINGFLKSTHAPGDPSRGVPGAGDANTVANVLNDIQGVGCRIEKPMDRGGLGWHIVVDGSTDISYPDGSNGPTALSFSKAITKTETAGAIKGGAGSLNGTWAGNFTAAPNIETNPSILEASTNGIIVKEGFAGVFKVHMTLQGTIATVDVGSDWYLEALVRIGGTPEPIAWTMFYEAPSSTNAVVFPVWTHTEPTLTQSVIGSYSIGDKTIEENSTSSCIFVDATAGDVLVDLKWKTRAANGASYIILREFTLELSELITAPVAP